MVKTKNKISTLILTVILFILLSTTIIIANNFTSSYAAQFRIDELFYSNEVNITMNEKPFGSGEAGVLLSTNKDKSQVKLSDKMTGKFSMSLVPFGDKIGVKGFNQLVISVSDTSANELFSFVAESVNTDWTKVYLTKNGAIISDEIGVKLSFAYLNSNTLDVFFDLSSGEAGIVTDKNTKFDVNLLDYVNASEFNVSININNVRRTSNIIINSINGQKLNGSYINSSLDKSAPTISVENFSANAIVNKPFSLPKAVAYDIVDKNDIELKYSVMLPNGSVKNIESGATTFTPTEEGKHYIMVSATDKVGNKATVSKEFLSRKSYGVSIELNGIISDEIIIGTGEKITFPSAKAFSEFSKAPINLVIENNNYNGNNENSHTFNNAGDIKATYVSKINDEISASKEIIVKVQDIPVVNASVTQKTFRGDTLIIPKVAATKNGETFKTAVKLIAPDKKEIGGDSVVLDTVGVYTLSYSYDYNTVNYVREYFIEVSTTFDTYFSSKKDVEINANKKTPYYAIRDNGVEIKALTSSASFDYEGIIDFTTLKRKGTPLLEFYFTPEKQFEPNISAIEFTFTDVVDPTNKVRIYLRDDGTRNYYYLCNAYAAAGNNALIGNYWDRQYNTIIAKGSQPHISMRGTGLDDTLMSTSKIWFDYSDMSVWGSYVTGADINILKLNNATHVGAGNEWYGFVNGKAKMNVKIMSKGSMILSSVAGQSLRNEKLTSNAKDDKIVVDVDESNIPSGKVNAPFNIFSAKKVNSFDNISFDYSTKVFFNYGMSNAKEIEIKNNQFIPSEKGNYTIVYSSLNSDGEIISKNITVEVFDSLLELNLSFSQEEEAFFTSGMFLGRTALLPSGTVLNASGKFSTEYFYSLNGGAYAKANKNFNPSEAGTYSIKYVVTDYLGRKTEVVKSFTVTASSTFIYENKSQPINNGVVVSGKKYALPKKEAFAYKNGEKITCESKISYSYNGVEKEINGDFVPEVETNGDEIEIIYTPISGGEIERYTLTVIKTNDFLSDFFFGKNLTKSASKENVKFAFSGNSNIKYVNALPAFDFSVEMNLPSEKNGVNAVNITLKDSENANEKVVVGLVKNGQGTDVYLNNVFSRHNKSNLLSAWKIGYDDELKSLVKGSGTPIVNFTSYFNGNKFDGFTSNKLLLEIDFVCEGEGQVEFSKICGQIIDDEEGDYNNPFVLYEFERNAKFGDTVVLPVMVAVDIFDPNVRANITVRSPKKTVVLNKVNAFISQSFKIKEYGNYIIEINVSDNNGNSVKRSMPISVRDFVAPTINLNGTVVSEAKIGKEINLPTASVSDNLENDIKVNIFVYDAKGMLISVYNNKFTPTQEGVYRVVYFAEDSFYNYAKLTFEIKVK